MEQYILGWLHAVGIIFIIAMVARLVVIGFKINNLSKKVKDLEAYQEINQNDLTNNVNHLEDIINKKEEIVMKNIEDVQKQFEATLDSRINKLENKINK
jgi:predicted PurR-regulated permease PerM